MNENKKAEKIVRRVVTFMSTMSTAVSGIVCWCVGFVPDRVIPDMSCRIFLCICGFINVIMVVAFILSGKDS